MNLISKEGNPCRQAYRKVPKSEIMPTGTTNNLPVVARPACTYVQFIAVKSRDKRMMYQLARMLQETRTLGTLALQWELDDFEAIADEIEKLFRKLAWIGS